MRLRLPALMRLRSPVGLFGWIESVRTLFELTDPLLRLGKSGQEQPTRSEQAKQPEGALVAGQRVFGSTLELRLSR